MTTKKPVPVITLPKRSGSDCYVSNEIITLPDGRRGYLQRDATGMAFDGYEFAIFEVVEALDYGGNVVGKRVAPTPTRGIAQERMAGKVLGVFGRMDTLLAYADEAE